MKPARRVALPPFVAVMVAVVAAGSSSVSAVASAQGSQQVCERLRAQGLMIFQKMRASRRCVRNTKTSVGGVTCVFKADETVVAIRGLERFEKQQLDRGHAGSGLIVASVDPKHHVRVMHQKIGTVLWIHPRRRGAGACILDIAIIDTSARVYSVYEYIRANRAKR